MEIASHGVYDASRSCSNASIVSVSVSTVLCVSCGCLCVCVCVCAHVWWLRRQLGSYHSLWRQGDPSFSTLQISSGRTSKPCRARLVACNGGPPRPPKCETADSPVIPTSPGLFWDTLFHLLEITLMHSPLTPSHCALHGYVRLNRLGGKEAGDFFGRSVRASL